MDRFFQLESSVDPNSRQPLRGDGFPWVVHGPSHAVHFYEDRADLCRVVGAFLAQGLSSGQPTVIIASSDHLALFLEDLAQRGFAVDALQTYGRLTILDAEQLMAGLIVDGRPDRRHFRAVVADVIARAGGRQRVVRAYGEIVDLLCKAGNAEGAIALEELWNELASEFHLALLCGYAVDNFLTTDCAAAFEGVCGQHSHVVPALR